MDQKPRYAYNLPFDEVIELIGSQQERKRKIMKSGLVTKTKFKLTGDHLSLLRELSVGWSDSSFGAPEICSKRPYGNSSVLWDMGKILGIERKTDKGRDYLEFSDTQTEIMPQLHREMQYVLQIGFQFCVFDIGEYETEDNVTWTSHPTWKKL